MRRYVQGLVLPCLVALTSPTLAQYAAPTYYYPPTPAYYPTQPYAAPAQGGYYQQPQQQQVPVYYYAPQAAPMPQPPRLPLPPARPAPTAVKPMILVPVTAVRPAAPAPVTSTVAKAPPTTLPAAVTSSPVVTKTEIVKEVPSAPAEVSRAHHKDKKGLFHKVLPVSINLKIGRDADDAAEHGHDAIHDAIDEGTEGGGENCPPRRNRFLAFADGLYWNVHNSRVPFAQAFDGTQPNLSVPRGPVGVAELSYTGGIRAGAGLALSECSWLVGTFTYYENETEATIMAPDGTVLQSNLIFPNTVNAAFTPLVANADYSIRLLTADADYKHAFVSNDCVRLCWLAGFRYGRLQQSLFTEYQEVLGAETIQTRINFNGAGLRTGIDGEFKMGAGFYGYGKGVLSLMAGRFGGNYEQRDVFGGLVAISEINEKRIVPVLEIEPGFGWMSPKGRVRMSAGYYVGTWLNTLTTTSLVRGIQNNDFTTNSDNFRDEIVFNGLVGHFELRY